MRILPEMMEGMMNQIKLDCNVNEAVEISPGMFLAPSKILDGARIIHKMDPFFRVVVFMGKAYVMADESILGGCEELFTGMKPEWFFEFSNLRTIDYILHEYGKEIVDTHIYFLPSDDAKIVTLRGDEIWLNESDIIDIKDTNVCKKALCYSPTQPDVIAVMQKDGEKIKGMAGASKDGKYAYQIGIDVLNGYEGQGIGVHLVSLLKQRLMEEGKVPFYGTNESHAISRTIAVKAGFLPAFSEFFVSDTNDKL